MASVEVIDISWQDLADRWERAYHDTRRERDAAHNEALEEAARLCEQHAAHALAENIRELQR